MGVINLKNSITYVQITKRELILKLALFSNAKWVKKVKKKLCKISKVKKYDYVCKIEVKIFASLRKC